jgi:AcrR family transcriptional regulator
MNKTKENKSSESKTAAVVGRKRDDTADARIIEAAIEVLAEAGFDGMTMDMVAARAKAGKATVYRRWDSKAELVRDALIRMSRNSMDLENIPDTGTLRGDLLALLKPYTKENSERKLRVLARLGSFFSDHQKLAAEALDGIFEPWISVNRQLMQRATERGEISATADIEMVCEVLVSMTYYRTVTLNKQFDKVVYSKLLDGVLLPALKRK